MDRAVISIGGKRYRCMEIDDKNAYQHIIVDRHDNVYYITTGGILTECKRERLSPNTISGLPEDQASDIQLARDGNLIISSSESGFYKYNPTDGAAKASAFCSTKGGHHSTAMTADGSLYSVTSGLTLDLVQSGRVESVPGVQRPHAVTVDKNCDIYYSSIDYDYPIYLVRRGTTRPIRIEGLPVGVEVELLAYDNLADQVYICRHDGLYFLKPPSTIATPVQGTGRIQALGFDFKGNIYMGVASQILKLVPCDMRLSFEISDDE